MRIKFIFLAVFFSNLIFAQKVELIILDSQTENASPVPYANVCVESMDNQVKDYYVTDLNGVVNFSLPEQKIVSISSMGFETLIDTISPAETKLTYILTPALYEINSVVVTGQYKPVSADKSIYDIKLIGKNQIESKAASNLSEILSNELGIRLSNDPSTGTSLSLQGITGENIKILVDGVPVIGRLDGNIDLSQLNLGNVSHIEMVEGPMSVIYGSNALGGVINIITENNSHANYKTSVSSYYESIGTYNFNFLTSIRTGKNTFELNGGRNFFSGYSIEDTRSKQWKPKEQYNAGATYYFTTEKTKFRYKSDFFRERLLDRNDPAKPYFEIANDTWFKTTRFNNSIDITNKSGKNSGINMLAAYSFYERQKQKYRVDLTDLSKVLTTNSADHDTSAFHAFMARGTYNFTPEESKFSFQSGFDINFETGNGKRIANNKKAIGDYAIFASLMWKPYKEFTVQPGIRVAYNTKYSAPLVPSFNLMYKHKGTTTFRASYARGFRAPSLKELYLDFVDTNHEIYGNVNLEAERSHNFIISLNKKVSIGKATYIFDAKSFYNFIDNKIQLVNINPKDDLAYQNQNIGRFESIGGELKGSLYYSSFLKVNTGFSRIGRQSDEKKGFVYSNNFNADANINFLKNTASISFFYKFYGQYPYYDFSTSDPQLLTMDNFQNLDLTVTKKLFKSFITVAFGAKNIFNNKEINVTGIDATSVPASGGHGGQLSDANSPLVGWGRTFFLSLKINFVKY